MSRTHLPTTLLALAAAGAALAPAAMAGGSPGKRTPAERDAARQREAANDAVEQALKGGWSGGAALAPKAPRASAPGKIPEARRGLVFHEGASGAYSGATRDLAIEAGPSGVRVQPLEDGVPRADRALGFALAEVRSGARAIAQGSSAAPLREAGADAVVYRRASGIDERYQLTAGGVEQTFVLNNPGALGPGEDLVIEGVIETALASDAAVRLDAREPIAFSDAGGEALSYGRAFALDAAGRRTELAVELAGGRLSITVEAAWLAQAVFPVTVDPAIGSFWGVASGPGIEHASDVAYSATSDAYLVVWEQEYSSSDHDIWALIYDAQGAPLTAPFAIDDSTDDSLRPSVAWSPNGNRFLVAWEDDANLVGAFDIFGSIVNMGVSPAVYGPAFEVYASASNHGLAHVGAEDSASGGFVVVWTLDFWLSSQDYDSEAHLVSAAGAPVGGLIDLDSSSGYDTYDTTVNKLGRGATPWLAAMVDDRAVAGDLDVFVRSISSGGALGPVFDVAYTTDAEFSPSVAGDGTDFAIAYARDVGAASGTPDRDLYVQRASASARAGSSYVAALSLSFEDQPSISRWEGAAAPAGEYLVAWHDASTTPASIRADRLTSTLGQIENDVAVSASFDDARPAVAARRGAARQEWLVAWERAFSSADVDVRAQRVQDVPPPAPVADFVAATRTGAMPLAVTFQDLSSGGPTSWAWDFQNDGVVDATSASPSFTYTAAGTYAVSLRVSGPGGTDTETKTGYVVVTNPSVPAPVADFAASIVSGTVPLSVDFTDHSTGQVTDWSWSFGDGVIATAQHPSHIFTTPGTFTIFLTVSGPGGNDTKIRQAYITVSPTQGGGTGGSTGGSSGGGSTGGGATRGAGVVRSGGGGGGGCAVSAASTGAEAAGGVLPLLAVLAVLGVSRRRLAR